MRNNGKSTDANHLIHECTEPFREDAFGLDEPSTLVDGPSRLGKSGCNPRRSQKTVPLGWISTVPGPEGSDPISCLSDEREKIDCEIVRALDPPGWVVIERSMGGYSALAGAFVNPDDLLRLSAMVLGPNGVYRPADWREKAIKWPLARLRVTCSYRVRQLKRSWRVLCQTF